MTRYSQEMKTVSLWLSENTHSKMLRLQKKIEAATGLKLTHDLFIDTLLNYEPIIVRALDNKEST